MKIKNREGLLSTGDIETRAVVLDIVEESLQVLDVFRTIDRVLSLDGDVLSIGDRRWNLGSKRRIFVVGAGKACNAMAKALESKLGDRISKGLAIVKKIEPGDALGRIELVQGGHPTPNEEGLYASKRILEMVEQATSDDLFIGLISGGSSSLMTCPVAGITLQDEIAAAHELLTSGARILEINAVRRHISATNGGRLAQRIEAKGAEMINLIVSDVVGNGQEANLRQPVRRFFGTPVAPDSTTIQDAVATLKKYRLESRIPSSIVMYLQSNDPIRETPEAFGDLIHHFVLQTPSDASEAAKQAAERRGLAALILTTMLEGEAREAGTFLACVAKEILSNHRPIQPPCIVITNGETTTRIDHASGRGGPSQELSLGFALEVAGLAGCCIAALDTDGTDGPTEVAGGIADSTTVQRARLQQIDVYGRLVAHDSYTVLKALGDEILTGNTGTNVCDLNVIFIPKT